jgi:hypothetical protein
MTGSGGPAASLARASGQLSPGRASSCRRIDGEGARFDSTGAAGAAGRRVDTGGSTAADRGGVDAMTIDVVGPTRRAAGRGRAGAGEGPADAADSAPPVTEATSVPQAGHDSRPPETSAPHEGQAIGFLGNVEHLDDQPPA